MHVKRRDAAGEAASPQSAATPGARTLVLVHGAWHGGWRWRDVAGALRAAGHLVCAPILTGLGETAHLANPAVDLTTHATDVMKIFEIEELADAVVARDSKPFLAPEAGAARKRVAIDGNLAQ